MSVQVGAISLAATAIESLPLEEKVDDNLTVPGVAAFMGIMLLQVGLSTSEGWLRDANLHALSLPECCL